MTTQRIRPRAETSETNLAFLRSFGLNSPQGLYEFVGSSMIRETLGIILAEFDGESVLLDTNSGQYFALNETGGALWKLALAGGDAPAIATQPSCNSNVPFGQILDDTNAFMRVLCEAGLCDAE